MEQITEEKQERLFEIKMTYKKVDPSDEEAMAEKQREIEEVKREMDEKKEAAKTLARQDLEAKKADL